MRQFATDLFENGNEGDVLKKNSNASMDFGFSEEEIPSTGFTLLGDTGNSPSTLPEVFTLNSVDKDGLVFHGITVELSVEGEEDQYEVTLKFTNTSSSTHILQFDDHLVKCNAAFGSIMRVNTYDDMLTINKVLVDPVSKDMYIDFTFATGVDNPVNPGDSVEVVININSFGSGVTVDTNDLYKKTEFPIAATSNE